ncbi:hypothetical protein [Terrisporobacter sp.]|uniref:hypothetical protein n=1 Tax=Terrisporobacter sp. TaxID=1965305 RepID=UPI00289A5019|nr:hypothetical protein [Terrisporobacter sp.]
MSDYKIKVGCELDNDLKEQIDKYVHDTAFQLGLKYKLEKIELDEDDTLIMRIPTDEDGDILVDYEEVQEYYNALKNNVECKNIFAMPDAISLKVIDDETLELLAESINEELNKRKENEYVDYFWNQVKETHDETVEDFARKIKSKIDELIK